MNFNVYESLVELYPEAKGDTILPEKINELTRSISAEKRNEFIEFVFRNHKGKTLPSLPVLIRLVDDFKNTIENQALGYSGDAVDTIEDFFKRSRRFRTQVFYNGRSPEFQAWFDYLVPKGIFANVLRSIKRNTERNKIYSDEEFARVAKNSSTLLGWWFPCGSPELL